MMIKAVAGQLTLGKEKTVLTGAGCRPSQGDSHRHQDPSERSFAFRRPDHVALSFETDCNIGNFLLATGYLRVIGHGTCQFAESVPFYADNNLGSGAMARFLIGGQGYQAILTWHKWNRFDFQIVSY